VSLHLTFAQAAGSGEAMTAWSMIVDGTTSTKVVMLVLALFNLLSWGVIIWKFFQYRKMDRQADIFISQFEKTTRLEDAYAGIRNLPESAFTRVFRKGVNFYSELRPGALSEGSAAVGLSAAQLEVLRLVLEKEEGEEVDNLAKGLPWLAATATAGPLLGLLGTVFGVMNSFVGVASAGSANITAVAPGIAEALIATAAGLVVAIPAAICYNIFASRLKHFTAALDGFSRDLIGTLAREGKI
jgi:biopolymer transport protein TolQ